LKVFVLTGSEEQQDTEIAALFRDAQVTYGDDKVLGILATKQASEEHRLFKRQAPGDDQRSTTMSPTSEPPKNESVLFETVNKPKGVMLYARKVPILRIKRNNSTVETFELIRPVGEITTDDKGDSFKMQVKFSHSSGQFLQIKFVFKNESSFWKMSQIEVELGQSVTLNIIGEPPSAPFGYSYLCKDTFVYRNRSEAGLYEIEITELQVQPYLFGNATEIKFGKPYDCVGIVTPTILAGLFVTTIVGIVLSIALSAIMDIKTPNKFENRASKQLTFTVQE
jgi:hypothetical protein